MTRRDKSIGLDAIVLTIYLAVAPMHQTLVLSNGSTVVKYLALLTMAACMLWGYVQERRFIVIWDLIWPVLLVFGWFALTILWSDSRSAALSSLISIGSYCALILIVGSKRWNDKEKTLTIHQRKGEYKGMLKKRNFRIVIGAKGDKEPKKFDKTVSYEGKKVTVKL